MNRDSASPPSTDDEGVLRTRLRLFLEVTRLSQRDFATRSRVPQAAISRFLSGASLGEANVRKILGSLKSSEQPTRFADEVVWACRNVDKMRDTDVLPRPPEFPLLTRAAVPILAALGDVDLAEHVARTPRTLLAPKLTGGFRMVAQLDPVDTLLYSAAVHSFAPLIEAVRAPVDEVFSFRFEQRADGYLWRNDLGWGQFVTRGEVLASDASRPVVLVADIADFYGQVGIPTVVEALEDAGVPSRSAGGIGRFLTSLAGRKGRGLPIGPHPSALLAELVLDRVDRHLERTGRPFIRYVDDMRIFCASVRDAHAAWHDLASFLAERLGLGLNDTKTRVDSAATHAKAEHAAFYQDPDELQLQEDDHVDNYVSPESNIYAQELHRLYATSLVEALDPQEGSMRRVRLLLRRAPATSLDALLMDPDVLVRLVPTMRELPLYLLKPRPQSDQGEELAARVLWLAQESDWADVPFVRLWVAEVLATRFPDVGGAALDAFLVQAQADVGLGAAAVLASSRGDREWVRSHEKGWDNLSPWDRRAVLSAAKVLTERERERWAQRAEEHPSRDPLLIALAHEIRLGTERDARST